MNTLEQIFDVIYELIFGIGDSGGGTRDAVGGVITWAQSYLSLISENTTLILICIAIPLVGLGIGIIRRLVKVRA